MANLKEVRIRIASVKSTQQITSAMKMVSASKLRKAQTAIHKMRPYAAKVKEILQNLSATIQQDEQNAFSEQRAPETVLLIVVASNRGLCGAFNSNIIKAANELINQKYRQQYAANKLHLMTIGSKVTDYFSKRGFPVIASHDAVFEQLSWEKAEPIASDLLKQFEKKQFDRIEIVYNQFKNAALQRLTVEQFLPIELPKEDSQKNNLTTVDYIFEPSKEIIVEELIPKSLKSQFYKILLDSFASEHGARMTAMHQATDNAKELLKTLNLQYNKARQAAITNEILEIVSGANALKG